MKNTIISIQPWVFLMLKVTSGNQVDLKSSWSKNDLKVFKPASEAIQNSILLDVLSIVDESFMSN